MHAPYRVVMRLGDDNDPRVRFSGTSPGNYPTRTLIVDEEPAFELSHWCGTCQFLFKRLDGSTATLGQDCGGDDTEALIARYGALLPAAEYEPMRLEVVPRLVMPAGPGDYFAGEQVSTWGLEDFWGLPVYPSTPYYRTFETAVDSDAHLYEFVVPMVPPSWNERETVDRYAAGQLDGTAVAISILDVCAPAVDRGPDYHAHWGLTHFLLDGHHRMQAAAETGRPVRLLSLLHVTAGLAEAEQIARLPELRRQPAKNRRASIELEDEPA